MSFTDGVADGPLGVTGDRNGRTGTEVTLPAVHRPPSPMTEFDFDTLEHRLRELAFLNSGVRIVLTDKRGVEERPTSCSTRAGSKPSCAISTAPSSR